MNQVNQGLLGMVLCFLTPIIVVLKCLSNGNFAFFVFALFFCFILGVCFHAMYEEGLRWESIQSSTPKVKQ